ncbi:MAG: DUF1343 domain-containing protein [candidate division KSB1 bacterium]|nr:DUF1343 domain-containing protein [candidate division KSB1 bacterium]
MPRRWKGGSIVLAGLLAVLFACRGRPKVQVGADRLLTEYRHLVAGKRVGLITNQTGVTSSGQHLADLLHADPEIRLVALFAPEHGIRGTEEAGATVRNGRDVKTGLPIYSLYGATRKPTPEMLQEVDVLVFDIQDVGARFYTYISTMSLAMEAAADQGIPFVVLDRPNPIGGEIVEGPVLEPDLRSFVGIHPIALRHGMTVGELARMFAQEGWLSAQRPVQLHVVPMRGWQRHMLFWQTGLPWIRPSPNISSDTTALLYPGMGLLEATNVSEGRGTAHPFRNVGAPWLQPEHLLPLLGKSWEGLTCTPTSFVPTHLPGVASRPKYEGLSCRGIWLDPRDPQVFQSVRFGLRLLWALRTLYADSFRIDHRGMELLTGSRSLTAALERGAPFSELQALQDRGLEEFLRIRQKYLLY